MKRAITFLVKVFFNDGVQRALPLITLLIGSSLFALSYLAYPAAANPVVHDATKSLAQLILVSGLVGVLLGAFKYMGIFSEAVHDVVFGDKFLRTRNDLPAVWSRVTAAITQGKFPQLSEQLEADVLRNYIPTQKDFFYSGYKHECIIRPMDGYDDIVKIYEKIEFTLHPANAKNDVSFSYNSWTDSRTPTDIARLNLIGIYVDNIEQDVSLLEEQYPDEFGGIGLKQSFSLVLKGKNEYLIRRHAVRKLRIAEDPVVEYSSSQFILKCEAKFRSEVDNLFPIFQPVGTDDFEDRTMGPEYDWNVHREFGGLMFPRQGYILFIQRRLSPESTDSH